MPYKTFVAGEEALAADANSYLMSQTVPRFTSAAQRTSQLTAPVLNQLSIRDDRPGILEGWNGSAWVAVTPGAELAYAQITVPVPITNTSAAGANLVVDGGTQAYDGGPVIIEFYSANVLTPSAGALHIALWDGATPGTDLGLLATSAGQISAPVHVRQRITPSAGNHNYRIAAWGSVSGGSVSAGTGAAGAQTPAFLRISRA
jgi:hypothetical protein